MNSDSDASDESAGKVRKVAIFLQWWEEKKKDSAKKIRRAGADARFRELFR